MRIDIYSEELKKFLEMFTDFPGYEELEVYLTPTLESTVMVTVPTEMTIEKKHYAPIHIMKEIDGFADDMEKDVSCGVEDLYKALQETEENVITVKDSSEGYIDIGKEIAEEYGGSIYEPIEHLKGSVTESIMRKDLSEFHYDKKHDFYYTDTDLFAVKIKSNDVIIQTEWYTPGSVEEIDTVISVFVSNYTPRIKEKGTTKMVTARRAKNDTTDLPSIPDEEEETSLSEVLGVEPPEEEDTSEDAQPEPEELEEEEPAPKPTPKPATKSAPKSTRKPRRSAEEVLQDKIYTATTLLEENGYTVYKEVIIEDEPEEDPTVLSKVATAMSTLADAVSTLKEVAAMSENLVDKDEFIAKLMKGV